MISVKAQRRSAMIAALLVFQSCSGRVFDVVVPRMDAGNGWFVDPAGYFVYRADNQRLSIFVTPALDSGTSSGSLRIRLLFEIPVNVVSSLDMRQVVLVINDREHSASAATCTPSFSKIDGPIINLQQFLLDSRIPCLNFLFEARQPDDWTKASLQINQIYLNDDRITVPQIHFRKLQRNERRGFT